MARSNRPLRALTLIAAFALLLAGYFDIARPWYLRWGATDDEVARTLPGDEILPVSGRQETRAITINAPMAEVWPWLAQLGQDRAGFYSFDLLENAVGCEMPTSDRLRPDRQTWQTGDRLWMYPKEKAGGIGYATLRTFVPGRALAFGTHAPGTHLTDPDDGSWAFVLEPIDRSTTRFLVRGRGAPGRALLGVAFDSAIFEPAHFVMERRMMIGISQVAEGSDRQRLANHLQVVLWVITFALFVASIVLVMRRKAWRRPLAAFVASGIAFQILTFVQPPVPVGALLVLGVAAILWPPRTGAPLTRPAIVTGSA